MGRCELRQPDGEEEVEAKSLGGVGGGATTGVTRQPAGKKRGKREGRHTRGKRRGGVSGQEAAERREDERRRQHDVRCCDNQVILLFYTKPRVIALNQPLLKRLPASDWADPQIPRCGRGKCTTMVVMFVDEFC